MAFGDFVQATSKDAGTVNTTTLAFGSNVTAGNTVIVTVRRGTATSSDSVTVSDNVNAGNYTLDVTQETADPHGDYVYRMSNALGGATTISVTFGGVAKTMRFCIGEYAGNFALHGTPVAATASSASPSSGNQTTTLTAAIIGLISTANIGTTYTATGGMTLRADASANHAIILQDHNGQQVAGSYAASGTLGTVEVWGAIVFAYVPAAAAAVIVTPPLLAPPGFQNPMHWEAVNLGGPLTHQFSQNPTTTVTTSSSVVNQVGATKTTTAATATTQVHGIARAVQTAVTTSSAVTRSVGALKALGVTTAPTAQKGVQSNLAGSVTTSSTLTFLKVKLLTLVASITSSAAAGRAVATTKSLGATTAATTRKGVGRTLPTTVSTTSVLSFLKVKLLALSASVATTPAIARGVAKALGAVASTTPTYQRLVGKTTSSTAATSPVLGKSVAKTVVATVTTTASTAFLKVKLVLLQASVTATAITTKSVGLQIPVAVDAAVAVIRAVGKKVVAQLLTVTAVQKLIGKTISSTVVTVPLLGASKTSGTSFSGSVVAWIPYIPDETALGQTVTLQVVFAAADGSRPVLDAAPVARVFQDNGGTEAVLAGPTAMTPLGTGWTLAYTPTTVGPQALEVRGLLSGATQFYCVGFTVRPQFDPIALAVNDVLASRM